MLKKEKLRNIQKLVKRVRSAVRTKGRMRRLQLFLKNQLDWFMQQTAILMRYLQVQKMQKMSMANRKEHTATAIATILFCLRTKGGAEAGGGSSRKTPNPIKASIDRLQSTQMTQPAVNLMSSMAKRLMAMIMGSMMRKSDQSWMVEPNICSRGWLPMPVCTTAAITESMGMQMLP